jgi:hypothetical protein
VSVTNKDLPLKDINIRKLELRRLACMMIILSELKKRTVICSYDKLSFKKILD